jgi:hypothetical protein
MVKKKHTVLFLSLLLASTAVAETYYVPGDYPGIQEAINACSDGDTVLVSYGIYEGPFSFVGKSILVKGLDRPILWAFWDYSSVYFQDGEERDAILEGFVISGRSSTGWRMTGSLTTAVASTSMEPLLP